MALDQVPLGFFQIFKADEFWNTTLNSSFIVTHVFVDTETC
jgi:hypothetical protein